jgi:dTDP-4-amino-4,6-dideoxygalactose transaminase
MNYLPRQYATTNRLGINHNYLLEQFAERDAILSKIRDVVIRGDFTLGEEVDFLEAEFSALSDTTCAVSVGSGTDALFLSLKALGIREGDEVITTPFTFYATIGAIVTAGAKPVFVDIGDDYNIDVSKIESKITSRTKAIMPVHWAGRPCDFDSIDSIATKYGLFVVSDACHAISALYKGRNVGGLGTAACFSFHPLKNLNVWGDGGIVTTNSTEFARNVRLLRNHGLVDRDHCERFAYNSRLDTIQAVVARHMLPKIDHITRSRIDNAHFFDAALSDLAAIQLPSRDPQIREVFHLYSVLCDDRDALQRFLISRDIDAKVHYPIPMHLQPASAFLQHKAGDFPNAEAVCRRTLSLPVHEFINRTQQERVVSVIREFYGFGS